MGWDERSYHRDRPGAAGNPLLWLFTGSMPLFTVFGIRVRAHASLLLLIALDLLLGHFTLGYYLQYRLTAMGMLFCVVLLHEFGHCFAARWMGGSAEDILMWPLGGLAFAQPPHRPWPTFVTVAGGPLVNVLICLVTGAGVFFFTPGHLLPPLNPFGSLLPRVWLGWNNPALYCWWLFTMSYLLFLFNLLPIFPLDGGQMFYTALWPRLGERRAMDVTTLIGIPGGIMLGILGLVTKSFILIFLGLWGVLQCFQQRAMLKETAAEEAWAGETHDFSASLFQTEKPRRRKGNKRAIRRARKIAQAEAQERSRVDAILAKVSAHGMQSLNWSERRALRKATEHQRQRDLDVKL